jgi:hypothetical protein
MMKSEIEHSSALLGAHLRSAWAEYCCLRDPCEQETARHKHGLNRPERNEYWYRLAFGAYPHTAARGLPQHKLSSLLLLHSIIVRTRQSSDAE